MADVNDDAMGGYRRIEVLTGPGRRRQWSAEQKAQIVAESLVPEAIVTDVARRWQVCPQQVFGWWRQARAGLLALPAAAACSDAPMFVPIVTEAAAAAETPSLAAPASMIEVTLAGAVIRIPSGVDGALLTSVLQAVRASALRRDLNSGRCAGAAGDTAGGLPQGCVWPGGTGSGGFG